MKFISFFKKNALTLFELVAFITAIVASVLYSNKDKDSAVITLIVVLICFSIISLFKNIMDNKNRDMIYKIYDLIETRRHPYKLTLDSIMQKRDAVNLDFIDHAQEIYITGGSLVRIVGNLNTIIDKLDNHCTINFILVEPLTDAARILGEVVANRTEEKYNQQIINSLEDLVCCAEEYPERINIKTINYVPSLSFVATHISTKFKKKSVIKVEIYSRHGHENKRMNFVIKNNLKDDLYGYFREELLNIDKNSKLCSRENLNKYIQRFEESKKECG